MRQNDISFDHKPNLWFSTNISYEGEGTAEYELYSGRIEGKTIAHFEESGRFSIIMEVSSYFSDPELPLGIDQLLSGDEPIRKNNLLELRLPPIKLNKCKKIQIQTKDGLFVGVDCSSYISNRKFGNDGEIVKIAFYPKRSWFDPQIKGAAQYWTIPLINFNAELHQNDPDLGSHPLRIFPDLEVPDNLSIENTFWAEIYATQRNRLITFTFGGGKGFIEGLPDMEKRIESLKTHQKQNCITAILVAPLQSCKFEPVEEVDKWFPKYFIDMLDLATGNEVEYPWIEFRNNDGLLIRRIHKWTKKPIFFEGTKILDELFISRGIGSLLDLSQISNSVNETYFITALKNTVLGGRNDLILEDKYMYVIRAFETLCDYHGFKTQDLLMGIDDNYKSQLQIGFNDLRRLVSTLIKNSKMKEDFLQLRYLDKIYSRIVNVTNRDRDFGLAVCDLVKKFDLEDIAIIDKFLSEEPREDGVKCWSELISKYRGLVIHSGYFNFETTNYQFLDVLAVYNHLHDILIRILLLTIGYKDKYISEVTHSNSPVPIDWIKKNTQIEYLGYKEGLRNIMMTVSVEDTETKNDN